MGAKQRKLLAEAYGRAKTHTNQQGMLCIDQLFDADRALLVSAGCLMRINRKFYLLQEPRKVEQWYDSLMGFLTN